MELTPREIVSELDKYIVGQADAKRAVAVAIRNRWRRQQLVEDLKRDVAPRNILMIGSTGVGKTEIARRLATMVNAPFLKVEATKYTEVGYHGRDVETMIRDLLDVAIHMVRAESVEKVRKAADAQVEERILDYLLPVPTWSDDDAKAQQQRTREKLREQLRSGGMEESMVEISVEEKPALGNMFSQAGMDLEPDMQNMLERMVPSRRETRRMSVRDARLFVLNQEADKLIDRDKLVMEAIQRTEQTGIIFLDEIDKIAGAESSSGPDVSRSGVQRDLLPIVEGSTVNTRSGPVRTDHILFIAAGAFHKVTPSDLMPELQGRFPIRVELADLTRDDFVRILTEPHNSLTRQQVALLATEGVTIRFDEDAIEEVAQMAFDLNRKTQNIGARRLYTVMEKVFEQINYDAPDLRGKVMEITDDYVRRAVKNAVDSDDVKRLIL